jgi:hypothetical protein
MNGMERRMRSLSERSSGLHASPRLSRRKLWITAGAVVT